MNEASLLLAVNSGSSSIKYALFTVDAEPRHVCQGSVGSVGAAAAVDRILDDIDTRLVTGLLAGIVHRVVHGGERFDRAQRVATQTLAVRSSRWRRITCPRRSRLSRPGSAPGRTCRRWSASILHSIAVFPWSAAHCRCPRPRAFAATAFTACHMRTCSVNSTALCNHDERTVIGRTRRLMSCARR